MCAQDKEMKFGVILVVLVLALTALTKGRFRAMAMESPAKSGRTRVFREKGSSCGPAVPNPLCTTAIYHWQSVWGWLGC